MDELLFLLPGIGGLSNGAGDAMLRYGPYGELRLLSSATMGTRVGRLPTRQVVQFGGEKAAAV